MRNRIFWIDWAKAFGIMIVVFCHIPQFNTIEKAWLCSFQMPLFFFLSGYLHKLPYNWKIAIQKYWKTLIIPYLLFQPISYPYWIVEHVKQEGLNIFNLNESLVKPFLRCIIGIPIDGITWFIFALLIMKLITDIVLRSKYRIYLIQFLCLISITISYIFHRDQIINITFAVDSLFDFYPFFLMGYLIKLKKSHIFNKNAKGNVLKNIIYCMIFLVISIVIIKSKTNVYLIDRINFYILGMTGTSCIFLLSRNFNYCPNIITTISKGTIILLGLHWMFIGTTNYILERCLHLNSGILYTTFESIVLVLAITIVNYFIIIFCQRHFKIILGGRT